MHPREAFMAGHNLAYCVTYFDQVLMAARLASADDEEAQQHSQQMVEQLQNIAPHFVARLKHIGKIGAEHGIEIGELPSIPQEYRRWAPGVFERFVSTWQIEDQEGWLFLLGHAVGELRGSVIIASMSIDFQLHLDLSFQSSIDGFIRAFPEMVDRWENAILRLLNTPFGASFMPRYNALNPAFEAIQHAFRRAVEHTGPALLPLLRQISAQLAQIEQQEAQDLPSSSD
ncbi:MAG: hypothetical protein ACON4U_15630 [Myxococcota bacterium]